MGFFANATRNVVNIVILLWENLSVVLVKSKPIAFQYHINFTQM